MGKMKLIIVLMTASSKKEAENITQKLLEERLIACANIVDNVTSLFWWKEKIEQENETLVVMKSSEKMFKQLIQRIQELHSYEVPEILALPIVAGSQSYLDWMKGNLE
ncbi:MAG: divalent-cation tolerance protein CutA [Clostridiales bacterium]|nr:divalent-cation tolerance protein CutA [Clostridiales bacterium]